MVETLPMLEKDPRAPYKVSRQLRILAFSLVLSIMVISLLIVSVRFVYDGYVAPALDRGPYVSNPIIVLLAIVLIAGMFAKLLWDTAEGKTVAPRPRRK